MRRTAIVLFCSLPVLRCFGNSGLEVASIMILETEYGWDRSHVGIMVGLCALCGGLLMKALYDAASKRYADMGNEFWIRIISLIAVVASCMLFAQPAKGFTGPTGPTLEPRGGGLAEPLRLLAADAVLYPSFVLLSGLANGISYQHASKEPGGFFALNNVIILQAAFVDGLARNLAPPLARWSVAEAGGQAGYAYQQLCCCVVAFVLAEGAVRTNLRLRNLEADEEKAKGDKADKHQHLAGAKE